MRLILMGTGPFAVPAFEAIRRRCGEDSADHEIACVVTKPELPVKSRKGPPPAPVRAWAVSHGLPIFDPPSINDTEAIRQLAERSADLLVVCDYGQILKPEALAIGRLGGINLHGSLLPAYRGAAPVQRALLGGESETGVSIIHMTPTLDAGPILATARTNIRDDETSGELEERLADLGVEITLQSIELLSRWDGVTPIGETQDKSRATKAPRLHKREARIDWSKTSREIDLLVRGMQPWPVAFTEIKARANKPPLRLAILKVAVADLPVDDLQPGQLTGDQRLVVATGEGALEIELLKPAGKREMSGEEFIRGYQFPRGTRFGDA